MANPTLHPLVIFVVLGATSLVAQIVLARELLVAFYGNELFIILALGAWLFWTCLGSFWMARRAGRDRPGPGLLTRSYLLLWALLPLELFLARLCPIALSAAGEIPDLFMGTLVVFFGLAPIGLVLGFQFPAAVSQRTSPQQAWAENANRAYLFETLGFILAGTLFSFVLVRQDTFALITWLASLNAWAGLIHTGSCDARPSWAPIRRLLTGCLFFSLALVFLKAPLEAIEHRTRQLRYAGQTLEGSFNTYRGNITVTESQGQRNLYETGSLAGTTEETVLSEETAHLPLAFHPSPNKILLVGNGSRGVLPELFKYSPERITYAEPDPELFDILPAILPERLSSALRDPRVLLLGADLNYVMRRDPTMQWDIILLNLPGPGTVLLNRYYSQEFFQRLSQKLRPGGILAVFCPFSANTANTALIGLNASVYRALSAVFPAVLTFPEDRMLFIAGGQKLSDEKTSSIVERFRQRDLRCRYVVEPYLVYRLTNDRTLHVRERFQKETFVRANRDLFPVGYVYQTLYFISRFHPTLANTLSGMLSPIAGTAIKTFLLTAFLLSIFFRRKKRRLGESWLPAMGCAGFSLMSIQSGLIVAFQVFFGDLYARISLLVTVSMLGLALGTITGIRFFRKNTPLRCWVLRSHLMLAGIAAGPWIGLPFFSGSELLVYLASALTGSVVGLECALINALTLSGEKCTAKATAQVYGADLLGACLGAFLGPFFLIPALGIQNAFGVVTLANLTVWARLRSHAD